MVTKKEPREVEASKEEKPQERNEQVKDNTAQTMRSTDKYRITDWASF